MTGGEDTGERRRNEDTLLKAVLDSVENLTQAMHEGFRIVHGRVDDIYTKVGKIDGLNEKVNGFIQLMEKMNDHAAGDIESLKRSDADKEARLRSIETMVGDGQFAKLKDDVAGLKATGISTATRAGMWAKAGDVFVRNWLGPLAVLLTAYFLFGRSPQPPTVTIQPPAAIVPGETTVRTPRHDSETSTRTAK